MRSWQPMRTAAGAWVHPPGEGDLGGGPPASVTGSFSHLEESAFHMSGPT